MTKRNFDRRTPNKALQPTPLRGAAELLRCIYPREEKAVTTRAKVGFFVYFAILALLAIRGVQLLAGQFLPYQVTIVGMPWAEIPPNFQLIIAFLNKYAGGVLIVFCLCTSTLLLFPYRQGARWAVYAVPGLLLAYCAASANAMTQVLFAEPPIKPIAVFVVTIVVTFLVSISGHKSARV